MIHPTPLVWSYPARLEDHDGDLVARFPDLPEAITGARDRDEAVALAADALDVAVRYRLAHGLPVPDPRAAGPGEVEVALDPVTAGRVAFARAMAAEGLDKVAAARRIDRDEKVVRRILDGRGPVRFETVAAALKALGAPVALAFRPVDAG